MILLKVTKKPGFHPLFRKYIFQQTTEGVKFTCLQSHFRVNPFQPSVASRIETSDLTYRAKQMTVFYMKGHTWLKWVKCVPKFLNKCLVLTFGSRINGGGFRALVKIR